MATPLWLDEIGDADAGRTGRKAFVLARLKRLGFPVPDGFVLPPGDVDEAAIAGAFTRLGEPVAVRSSSTAEDGEDASFAGQYKTVLDVRGRAALLEAVASCRSADGGAAYAGSLGVSSRGALALLIQRFVEPEAAGVAFTRSPTDPSCLLVEAYRGRGEALVSGAITPDACRVDRTTLALRPPVPSGLDPALVRDVARLALEVEARLGGTPQDVEWALGPHGVVLLQARPITVEPADRPDPRITRLTRANVGEVMPDAVTPLTVTTLVAALEHAFRTLTVQLALRDEDEDTPAFLVVHQQRLYFNLGGSLEIASRLPGVDGRDAERLVLGGGVMPPGDLRPRVSFGSMLRAFRVLLRILALNGRLPADIEAMKREVAALDRPRTLDPKVLAAELRRLEDVAPRLATTHVATSGASGVRLALLGRLLPGWVTDPAALVNRLVAGQGGVASASSGTELERIAAEARERPDVVEWLARPLSSALTPDAPVWLRDALAGFLSRFGHRGLSEGELRAPAWEEDPAPLIAALKSLVATDRPAGFLSRARGEWRRADTEALLSRCALPRRLVLDYAIEETQRWVREREGTKSLAVAMVNHTRRLVRQGASLLAARGRLEDADDAYFLTMPELIAVLEGGEAPRARLRRRRRRFEREGVLPAPKEVDLRAPEGTAPVADEGGALRGIGVSSGIGVGVARVAAANQVPRLAPGEILVAPVLDAALAPHLATAAGAVAEVGGMLSHGSVVARELGVPCVVDVRAATTRIRDGDRIRVDGGTGLVTRLKEAGAGNADHEEPGPVPIDTAAEGLHEIGENRRARESIYLNAFDPATGIGLIAAMGVRRGGRGEGLAALSLPDGRVLFGLELGNAAIDAQGFAVGGLRYSWHPGRLELGGTLSAHERTAFPPSALPLLLSPRVHEVSLSLSFAEASPAIDFGEGLPPDVLEALRPLGPHHVEQAGRLRGVCRIDGQEIAFDGTGSRDHSWAERDWNAADHWRLFTVHFGPDLSILALALSVNGRAVQGGFLCRDGRVESLTRVDYAWWTEGATRGFDLEVQAAGGAPLLLQGTVVRTVTVPVQVDGRPWRHLTGRPYRLLLHENHTRYSLAGRTSYGIAEATERSR